MFLSINTKNLMRTHTVYCEKLTCNVCGTYLSLVFPKNNLYIFDLGIERDWVTRDRFFKILRKWTNLGLKKVCGRILSFWEASPFKKFLAVNSKLTLIAYVYLPLPNDKSWVACRWILINLKQWMIGHLSNLPAYNLYIRPAREIKGLLRWPIKGRQGVKYRSVAYSQADWVSHLPQKIKKI